MTEQQRKDYFDELIEVHVWGMNSTSAWTDTLSVDAQKAFISGAYLSTILICQAAMESHLKYEYYTTPCPRQWGFFELIENSSMNDVLRGELHSIRKYRNKWVHVKDPEDDADLAERPEYHETEMEETACIAMKLMFTVMFLNQFV